MIAFKLVAAVLPIAPALIIWALLLKLRHRGRPDVGAERVLVAYMAYCVVRGVASFVFPDWPRWVVMLSPLPLLILCAVFLASRIRRFPEALFSPATVRRWRSCRGHR